MGNQGIQAKHQAGPQEKSQGCIKKAAQLLGFWQQVKGRYGQHYARSEAQYGGHGNPGGLAKEQDQDSTQASGTTGQSTDKHYFHIYHHALVIYAAGAE